MAKIFYHFQPITDIDIKNSHKDLENGAQSLGLFKMWQQVIR